MDDKDYIRFQASVPIDYFNIVGTGRSPHALSEICGPGSSSANHIAVVVDRALPDHHLDYLFSTLDADFRTHVPIIKVKAGEQSKSLGTYSSIIDALAASEVHRRTRIIAVGGGVVLDTVGFVAATFMRGIGYLSVPTTLMAQVDAAVGGKVAINHSTAKNLIGAFWHPDAVLIDPAYLSTLPEVEMKNGLAEIVKVAVIDSPELFTRLEKYDLALRHDPANSRDLEAIIRLAVEAKIRLLLPDPFERDLKRVLNLGHTFAHALETQGSYRLRHGFAVSVGLSIATRIAVHRHVLAPDDASRILHILERFGLPTAAVDHDPDEVWEHTMIIRRIRGNRIHYVLPTAIGSVAIVDDLTREEFHLAFALRESPGFVTGGHV